MQEPSSTELQAALQAALDASEPEKIAAVFEQLALSDGYQIAKRARAYLEALISQPGSAPETDPLERAQQVTRRAFHASLWDYLRYKRVEVDPAFDGDVPGWIDANAAAVAAANLAIMRRALSNQHAADAGTPSKLEALVDVGDCQRKQRRILRDIWAGVETSIAEILGTEFDSGSSA
jgi:hypothetical protein